MSIVPRSMHPRDLPSTPDIIVETNYRVYAYTTSDLQIALLKLFVAVQYRLANLAVGVISRESVRDALTHGITSSQVCNAQNQVSVSHGYLCL